MITEVMILECYDAFRTGKVDHVPNGMNGTAARMTMDWLNSILITGGPYSRSGSSMQYRVILEKIKQDDGPYKAREATLALMLYCQQV